MKIESTIVNNNTKQLRFYLRKSIYNLAQIPLKDISLQIKQKKFNARYNILLLLIAEV